MKQLWQRYFAVLMAIIVLIANTGFGIIEHSCIVYGKSVHLISFDHQGCHHCKSAKISVSNSKSTISKKSCCQDKQRYENVETGISSSHSDLKFAKNFVAITPISLQYNSDLILWRGFCNFVHSVFSFSTIFYGRALLAWVQVWLL